MRKKNTIVLSALLLVLQNLSAQGGDQDFMRSTGKIYVVVAVIVAIFIGLVFFMVYLDKKLRSRRGSYWTAEGPTGPDQGLQRRLSGALSRQNWQ